MNFFQDYVTIGEHDYLCHFSYDNKGISIPFSGEPNGGFFLSHQILVNGSLFKIHHLSIVDSLGFGGEDKILKLTIYSKHHD